MAEAPLLHLDGLRVGRRGQADPAVQRVIEDLTIRVEPGQTHAIIGPPGGGAEAIAPVVAGNPTVSVLGGRILLRGDDIAAWPTDARPRAGLFVALGKPPGMTGVSLVQVLGQAMAARAGVEVGMTEIRRTLVELAERIGAPPSLLDQELDDRRCAVEIRQSELVAMMALEAELVVLDEPDAELGDDVIAVLVDGLASVRDRRPTLGTLASTQCRRLVDQLTPDCVHIMVGGRIVAAGGPELADRLRTEGYESDT